MMKFTRLFSGFVLATLGILSVPATGHCSLITNGSFEDNTTFHGGNHIAGDGTMQLFPGATNLTGWSVVNANNLDLAWEGPTNTYGIHASDGGYFLDLTGYHDASPYSGVEQMIATTAGAQYTLKFDLGSSTIYNGNGPADIIATAGSTTRNFSFFTGLTNDWHTETLNFTASLSSTVINLTGFSGGNYIGLDNVSVTETLAPVPEPALIVSLTGFAVAAFGLSRLRRRRAMAVEPLRSFRNRVGTISRFDTS